MTKQYRDYLKSPEWQQLRQKVFQRALRNAGSNNLHGICERCGYQPWKPCLQLHHKTYENIYHEKLDDLILLCPRCHAAEKRKETKFDNAERVAVLSEGGDCG